MKFAFYSTKLISLILFLLILHSCGKDEIFEQKDIIAESADIYKNQIKLIIGGRERVMLITEPFDAKLKSAFWSSSDTLIAKVNSYGVIDALSIGSATITVEAENGIYSECEVIVEESAIENLLMPQGNQAIVKEALIMIQGNGFTEESQILLRKHSQFKSANNDPDEILAEIHERASSYISFYCSIPTGWYDVVLLESKVEYHLGNIEVETPNIPEYQFNPNLIYWEDSHWRQFQLRGKVKAINVLDISTTISGNYEYTTKNREISKFNILGRVESSKWISLDDDKENSPYRLYEFQYDSKNRLVKTMRGSNNFANDSNSETIYRYNNETYYYPVSVGFRAFGKYYSLVSNFTFLKGLESISSSVVKKGETDPYQVFSMQFAVDNDELRVTEIDELIGSYYSRSNYVVTLENSFPVKSIESYYSHHLPSEFLGEYEIQITNEYLYTISKFGMPIETKSFDYKRRVFSENYIQDCPFVLTASFNNYSNRNATYEYDENWNLIHRNYEESSIVDIYYLSYDDEGNWTECKIVERYNSGTLVEINTVTRDIEYWD